MTFVYKRRNDGKHDVDPHAVNVKRRIVPRDPCVSTRKLHCKSYVEKLNPWDVKIMGFEDVRVVRNVQDVCRYEAHPKALTELFYDAGIIKKTRKCDKHGCGGTLRIVFNRNASDQWNRHGGYYYECDGHGHTSNNIRKAITFGTVFKGTLSLIKMLQMVYSYAVVSHQVKFRQTTIRTGTTLTQHTTFVIT